MNSFERRIPSNPQMIRARELALQRVLMVWIATGLMFMLLPGTFFGVWNLVRITGAHTAAAIDPAWLQAHGHAQIFGWLGTFILGIGFYSLTKMGRIPEFAVSRAWASWILWTAGVALRWVTNLWHWRWRWFLPVSAALELFGFLLFFVTVSRHRTPESHGSSSPASRPPWMLAVLAGSLGFFASLIVNLGLAIESAWANLGPAIPHGEDQRTLILFTWAFPVITIWGFSGRWLPVFLGLKEPNYRLLPAALTAVGVGVAAAMAGWWLLSCVTLQLAALLCVAALRLYQASVKPPKTHGVHPSFPFFVRLAYAWLLASAAAGVAAALWDQAGGIWGASRHALTVGFLATMVFSIGQRVLPAFCGMRVLYSKPMMFWSLVLLNFGCALRVASEIGSYESYLPSLWPLLPLSAFLEMAAVTVFAANLLLTFWQPPAHLAEVNQNFQAESA
jgi:uncharacterized protein involved in response to NO